MKYVLRVLIGISFLVSFSGAAFDNAPFRKYQQCIDDDDTILSEVIEDITQGIRDQDLIAIWAKSIIPEELIKQAIYALGNNQLANSEQLLQVLNVRLENSLFEEVADFASYKLIETKKSQCIELMPILYQKLQEVIFEAVRLQFELRETLKLAEQKQKVDAETKKLMQLMRQVEEMERKITAVFRGEL